MTTEPINGDAGSRKVVTMNVDFPGNSHKERDERKAREENKPDEKKVEKIISGEVVKRQKSVGRKIADSFSMENMNSVASFLLFDVLIPQAKMTLQDMLNQGLERKFYGDSHQRINRGYREGREDGFRPYNRMHASSSFSSISSNNGRREISQHARSSHDFTEVVISSRGEAEDVLDHLRRLIAQYDIATVSDLYEMVGIKGSFTDDKYGWNDLSNAGVRNVRGGYLLDLPRTSPID